MLETALYVVVSAFHASTAVCIDLIPKLRGLGSIDNQLYSNLISELRFHTGWGVLYTTGYGD